MVPTYYALVDANGRLETTCTALAGKPVVIKERKSQRSADQLRWLFGYAYPPIMEHCGYDAHEEEDLHDDLLGVRFGTKTSRTGLVVPAKRTRDLNTAEMSEFMEWLCRYAATAFDVVLELPDERIPVEDR